MDVSPASQHALSAASRPGGSRRRQGGFCSRSARRETESLREDCTFTRRPPVARQMSVWLRRPFTPNPLEPTSLLAGRLSCRQHVEASLWQPVDMTSGDS
ncbi:hypothetical protein CesoFtcFv8_025232 [Champsocephalus esox]|uniref:Uncharacterized protein n=1 Tax=Champsocephalus esox TaxID=159716 RepID=A0AAN8B414_9TELE|nr:hypothetical protein CesoFtcFv8_025232 [Champsocephalus esox]